MAVWRQLATQKHRHTCVRCTETLEDRSPLAGDLVAGLADKATLVADLNPTLTAFSVKSDIEFSEQIFFLVQAEQAVELWKMDVGRENAEQVGSFAGTALSLLEAAADRLYFALETFGPPNPELVEEFGFDPGAEYETQLWSTDGTSDGLQLELTVNQHTEGNGSRSTVFLEEVNDVLLASISWYDLGFDEHVGGLWSNASGTLERYRGSGGVLSLGQVGDEVYFREDNTWYNGGDKHIEIHRTNPLTLESQLVWQSVGNPPFSRLQVEQFEEIPEFEELPKSGDVSVDWYRSGLAQEISGVDFQTNSTEFTDIIATETGIAFVARDESYLGNIGVSGGDAETTHLVVERDSSRVRLFTTDYYATVDADHQLQIVETETNNIFVDDPMGDLEHDLRIIRAGQTPAETSVTPFEEDVEILFPIGDLNTGQFFLSRCGSLWNEQSEVLIAPKGNFCNTPSEIEVTIHGDFAWYHDSTVGEWLNRDLWTTDGTAGSARLIGRTYSNVVLLGDDVYYFGSHNELWRSNAASGESEAVTDLPPFDLTTSRLVVHNDRILFTDVENRLWATDGTPEGTSILMQFARPEFPWFAHPTEFVEVNGQLFFTADHHDYGAELWVTDGTREGTMLALDINPGADGSDPRHLVLSQGQLFFAADDGIHGNELWKIDFTPVASVPGDTNGDGFVDFDDFLVLSDNFGGATENGDRDGDFDGDGYVRFKDFLVLAEGFGHQE